MIARENGVETEEYMSSKWNTNLKEPYRTLQHVLLSPVAQVNYTEKTDKSTE